VAATVSAGAHLAVGKDDDQERRGRLLLLRKGALLAHRWARPLAAESDDKEQSQASALQPPRRYRNARKGAQDRHEPGHQGSSLRPSGADNIRGNIQIVLCVQIVQKSWT
jgi:hypothetical protein